MKKTTSDIIIVLDRSGSMESLREKTIEGFNMFLKEQKEKNPDALLTLIQFNHEYEVLFMAGKIRKVKPLNRNTYVPHGMTALLDAMGAGIKQTRERHKMHGKKNLPGHVIFVVITDGLENASRKYSRSIIFKKILKMERKHGWQFVYLGANQDAIREAGRLGICEKRAMNFIADDRSTLNLFKTISFNISNALESEDFEFTEEQRAEQKRDDFSKN